MKNEKVIGITLLFYQRKKRNYIAFLKSYIVRIKNWNDLQIKIKKIVSVVERLEYLGIEDIFYVSGTFKEKEVLGKSYMDEIVKIKDAKKLLLKQDKYTCKFQINKQKEKWFLFSLIYFYNDKSIGDRLSISCFTPIFAADVEKAKVKVRKFYETEVFLKKIVLFKLDKMSYTNLRYIGIEDISYVEEDVKKGGAYECRFKTYRKFEKIKDLQPSTKKIQKSFKQVMNI
ncbi:hypothetical protein D1631_17300 [Chryseobacterium nematophagum]|uniref:Uncharacterized protein n=1 Tax=Chryseobacterium nematophagum TaxID=2305228 RepID=A0A3M7TJ05_9FLAO|nr:hypothetical protein [Chryseobacterium nematophagum]RNA63543.1 hypothetical protein D1631_17300 [Chryseobacterium nematophagum]